MRVVWMYGAMHLKSTSAMPTLIVVGVTPCAMVVETGASVPEVSAGEVDPALVGAVVVVVAVLVPLPHAASTSATTKTTPRTGHRCTVLPRGALTSIPSRRFA